MKTKFTPGNVIPFIAITFLFTFFGCQLNENSDITAARNDLEQDRLFQNIAIRLSSALEHKEVRSFLKAKLSEKFDGDYESLFHFIAEDQIVSADGRTVTLSDLLFGNDSGINLDELRLNYPLLQIAMPSVGKMNVTGWDDENIIPLVAYLPTRIENDVIPAFDNTGKMIPLSANDAPSQLVFVIGNNERVYIDGKSNGRGPVIPTINNWVSSNIEQAIMARGAADYSSQYYDYYLINKANAVARVPLDDGGYVPYDPDYTDDQTGDTGTTCDRDNRTTKDAFNKMIFANMESFKRVNEWFDGGQEIHCKIAFGNISGAVSSLEKVWYGNDSNFKDCGLFDCDPEWFGLGNAEIVRWDKTIYGSNMLYFWFEHDSGSSKTYSTSFANTFDGTSGTKTTVTNTASFTITDGDDMLGQSIPEYCDNTDGDGYKYYTGAIYFYLRQL